jgi:superfamily I DNA and/or RNA helicase
MESPDAFVGRMLRLLEVERSAEIEETSSLLDSLSGPQLEARGVSLLRLVVAEEGAGLGGRILLGLEKTTGEALPPTRIQPGDIVRLVPPDPAGSGRARTDERRTASGVVWRKNVRRVTVAFDDLPEDGVGDGALRLDRVANDITYRRMRKALERLRALDRGRPAQLREILLGEKEPRFGAPKPLEPLSARLNPSQIEAVRHALSALDVALIHGPPGTGKTTAVCELIRQAVGRREKVLAAAPSNIAVDNLAEILAAAGARVVRLGHPARLLPSVVELSLDAQVDAHPHTRIAQDLRRDLARALKRLGRSRDFDARRAAREELRALRREIAEVESGAVKAILDGADVVLATCAGADDPVLSGLEFQLAVIDEAAQALEPAAWIPILRADRVVLAGDHRQLPPTIISREAARDGLGVTLFDRLMARAGDRISRLLTVQYRNSLP